MDSSRPTLPQEGPIWSHNANLLVGSEAPPPPPSWGMDFYQLALQREGSTLSFNAVQNEGPPPPSWGMDSSIPTTLPKEGPTSSFNVNSSSGSEEPPPIWGMDCYKPTLPKGGTTSFNADSAVGSEDAAATIWCHNNYSGVDSSWTEDNFTRLLFEHEDFSFESSAWTNSMPNFQEPARDGAAATTVPIYNQNFPPRSEVGSSSGGPSSFQFSVATPDHMRQLDTHNNFDMFNWSTANQEKDNLFVPSEYVVCNTSATTVCAEQLKERTILQKEGDWCPTTTRRHKHIPKVINERKPQRTPKTVEALKNENPPVVKRKYVRKNNLVQMKVGSTSKEQLSGKRKYMRKSAKRLLNFDMEKDQSIKVDKEVSNFSPKRYEVVNQAPLNVANLNVPTESIKKMRTGNGFQTSQSASRTLFNTQTIGSSSGQVSTDVRGSRVKHQSHQCSKITVMELAKKDRVLWNLF